jgi:hypothetical protein
MSRRGSKEFYESPPNSASKIMSQVRDKLQISNQNLNQNDILEIQRQQRRRNPSPVLTALEKRSSSGSINTTATTTTTAGAQSGIAVRALNSKRPFTPRESNARTLFGPKTNRKINERPPSSFSSIGSKSFESEILSNRPLSGGTRLSPIDKVKIN